MDCQNISCDSGEGCYDQTFVCTEDCILSCSGDLSCSSATLQCADGYSCELDCSTSLACSYVTVYGNQATTLYIHSSNSALFPYGTFHCPVKKH